MDAWQWGCRGVHIRLCRFHVLIDLRHSIRIMDHDSWCECCLSRVWTAPCVGSLVRMVGWAGRIEVSSLVFACACLTLFNSSLAPPLALPTPMLIEGEPVPSWDKGHTRILRCECGRCAESSAACYHTFFFQAHACPVQPPTCTCAVHACKALLILPDATPPCVPRP